MTKPALSRFSDLINFATWSRVENATTVHKKDVMYFHGCH